MRKGWLAMLLLLVITKGAQAQDDEPRFSHSFGVSAFFGRPTSAIGFTYSPRVNFLTFGGESALSAGTHATLLGGTINKDTDDLNYEENNSGFSAYCVDIPLVIEYNFGACALPSGNDRRFGFFAGAGYGFHNSGRKDARDMHTKGPVLSAGLRFAAAGGDDAYELRGQYMFDQASFDGKQAIIGVGLSYHF